MHSAAPMCCEGRCEAEGTATSLPGHRPLAGQLEWRMSTTPCKGIRDIAFRSFRHGWSVGVTTMLSSWTNLAFAVVGCQDLASVSTYEPGRGGHACRQSASIPPRPCERRGNAVAFRGRTPHHRRVRARRRHRRRRRGGCPPRRCRPGSTGASVMRPVLGPPRAAKDGRARRAGTVAHG